MPLDDALKHFHEILTDGLAADTAEALERQQKLRGLAFGDRPLCTVLRPRLLTPAQYDYLRARSRPLLGAFAAAHRAALTDASVLDQFGLTDTERLLFEADPGYPCPCPTSRLDAFYHPGDGVSDTLKFTEFNAETPAAPAYVDSLTKAFETLPALRVFCRRYEVRPVPARPGVIRVLLDSFESWAGRRTEPPRIAILDWAEVPTASEFRLFADAFTRHGFECRIEDPRNLEYRGGKLLAGDYHITLIYKRVLIQELIERSGIDCPMLRAVRDGAVCMVNPLRCKPLYKKASLAVLTDERNAHLFTDEQKGAIAAHIPWTRCLEERRTRRDGRTIDLIPYVLAQRHDLVIKPNDAYGGAGVVLGWEVEDSAWEQAVTSALRGDEPFVVQEKVEIPEEPFPSFIDGRVEWIPRRLDTDPYGVDCAAMEGCLTRISTASLINVTAGGGSTVPTLLVEPR